MPKPVKTSTVWKQLATTAEVDASGVLHSNMHFVETGSGQDFTVSISGHNLAEAGLFIGALLACAEAWKVSCGDTNPFPTVTHQPRAKDH